MKLYSVSLDDYKTDIENLNKTNFKLKEYKDNYISGEVNLKEDGVLSFATLYNKGWTVFIDDKKVDTFKNKYFLATNITKGHHKIKLIYKTLFVKEGFILSSLGWILFIIIILIQKKNCRK